MSLQHQHSELLKTLGDVGVNLDDIIVKNRQSTLYNAYKVKSELMKSSSKGELVPHVIKSGERMWIPPEGKYTHVKGAHINPISKVPSKQSLRAATLHNSHSRNVLDHQEVYEKLNKAENYPMAYKTKHGADHDVTHDLCTDPKKVIKLLQGSAVAELNFPDRSADFTSEVMWRLQLRN